MKIVGVGCGPGLLTRQAADVIRNATLIYGSERAIELVRDEISQDCDVREIENYRLLRTLPEDAVVLSTGDPMLSGLGYLPGEVISGISSVQYASAKLRISLTGILTLSAHGRNHAEVIEQAIDEAGRGRTLCLITDPSFPIKHLVSRLHLFPDINLIICQDLGYPEEQILKGTVITPPEPTSGMYILFILPKGGE